VRGIFERFAKGRSATAVVRELAAEGFVNKYGHKLDKGRIYKLLHNRVYVGDAVHKGVAYPGEHEAIVSKTLWDKVQAALAESPKVRAGRTRAQTPALLKGLIFGPDGRAMSPTHTRRGDKLYRYYVSQTLIKGGISDAPITRLPAGEVEAAVVAQLRVLLRSPEVVVATWRSARSEIEGLTEAEVRDALERFDPLWDELFPAEQARIVQLLVERVDVAADGIDIRLRVDGLASVFRDLLEPQRRAA
jgi:site-specific DNA recombinase